MKLAEKKVLKSFCKKCGQQSKLDKSGLCVDCCGICPYCGGVKSANARMCFRCSLEFKKLAPKKWSREDAIEMYVNGHNVTEIAKHMKVTSEAVGAFIRKIRDKCDYVMGVYVSELKHESPHQKKYRQREKAKMMLEKAVETHSQYKQDIENEAIGLRERLVMGVYVNKAPIEDIENEIIELGERLEILEEGLLECDMFLGLLDTPEKISREEKIKANAMKFLQKMDDERRISPR